MKTKEKTSIVEIQDLSGLYFIYTGWVIMLGILILVYSIPSKHFSISKAVEIHYPVTTFLLDKHEHQTENGFERGFRTMTGNLETTGAFMIGKIKENQDTLYLVFEEYGFKALYINYEAGKIIVQTTMFSKDQYETIKKDFPKFPELKKLEGNKYAIEIPINPILFKEDSSLYQNKTKSELVKKVVFSIQRIATHGHISKDIKQMSHNEIQNLENIIKTIIERSNPTDTFFTFISNLHKKEQEETATYYGGLFIAIIICIIVILFFLTLIQSKYHNIGKQQGIKIPLIPIVLGLVNNQLIFKLLDRKIQQGEENKRKLIEARIQEVLGLLELTSKADLDGELLRIRIDIFTGTIPQEAIEKALARLVKGAVLKQSTRIWVRKHLVELTQTINKDRKKVFEILDTVLAQEDGVKEALKKAEDYKKDLGKKIAKSATTVTPNTSIKTKLEVQIKNPLKRAKKVIEGKKTISTQQEKVVVEHTKKVMIFGEFSSEEQNEIKGNVSREVIFMSLGEMNRLSTAEITELKKTHAFFLSEKDSPKHQDASRILGKGYLILRNKDVDSIVSELNKTREAK
jgi:hypothetical protein